MTLAGTEGCRVYYRQNSQESVATVARRLCLPSQPNWRAEPAEIGLLELIGRMNERCHHAVRKCDSAGSSDRIRNLRSSDGPERRSDTNRPG